VDLAGEPDKLIQEWLRVVDRKRQERDALPAPNFEEE